MAFGSVVSLQSPNNIIDLWSEYKESRGLTEEMLAPLNGAVIPMIKALYEKMGTGIYGLQSFGVVGAYVFEIAPKEYRARVIIDPARIDSTPKPGEAGPRKLGTKYLVPPGATNMCYVPPHLGDWYDPKASYDLFIVEGVLNAVRLAAEGYHSISIPGVHNYHIGKKTSPIIPELRRILKSGSHKRVIIMFDSDAADPESNPKVWNANNVFALDVMKELGQKSNTLHICNPPARLDGGKNGPDDYLNSAGINEFNRLIASAECRRFDDAPLFQLQARVSDRFIYDTLSGQIWDDKIRGMCDKSHANLNMATEGRALDILGTRPVEITFNVDRFLQIPGCRVANGMVFNPGTDDSYFLDETVTPPTWRINTYNPADVPEAIKGDYLPAIELIKRVSGHSISAVNKLLTIVAYHAQNPALTPKYGLLFVGDKGSGKSTLARLIGLALSKKFHDTKVSIDDPFNAGWRGYACKEHPEFDPKMDEEALKEIITCTSYVVNTKYGKMYTARNHTLNIFTANTLQSKIQEGDRRMLICGYSLSDDKEFGLEIERLVGTVDYPGLLVNYFRHFLLEFDATGYHTLDPWTEIRDDVIDASKSYKASVKDQLLERFSDVEGLEIVPNATISSYLEEHRVNIISFLKEHSATFIKPAKEVVKIDGLTMKFRAFKNHEKWRREEDTAAYREQYKLLVKLVKDPRKF